MILSENRVHPRIKSEDRLFRDHALIFFDSDNLRPARDYTVAAHGDEGFAHRILAGRIGDHDHRHRLAGTAWADRIARPGAVTLHDGLQRYVLLRQTPRNG